MTPTTTTLPDEQVLVLMPTVKDGERTANVLSGAGIDCSVCHSLTILSQRMADRAGTALLTEEAVTGDTAGCLVEALRQQPTWSNFPLVVLAREGMDGRRAAFRESMNVTLVERPVRMRSLLSVLRAALRSRRHQYAVRDHLLERQRAEVALREERERYRVTLASIGDAVIATDIAGRVTFLNQVAQQLTGWSLECARGLPLEEVFRIVNETTRRVVENPAKRALQEGIVVGLANHTILLSRDGTEHPLDDSAAPIRGSDGQIDGAVLVFRDITERKQAERAQTERALLAALRSDVAFTLASGADLPAILQHCAAALVRHLNAAFARVWTLDDTGTVLELQASAGLYTHLDGPHSRVRVGEYKIGRIAQSQQPHLTNAVAADPNISDPAWARREGMVAFAGYPLAVDGRVVGVLALFARHALSETVLADLAPLADAVAQCIERKRGESELRKQTERLRLLWEAASVLLTTEEPDAMLRGLFAKIAPHLNLDTYFNFMLNEAGDGLRLESCTGIPAETAQTINRLEFGQAICGTVALHGEPIAATFIQQSDDPKVQLVKSFGVRTYACNPLMAGERLLGTLSFASRSKDQFTPDELEFLRTITRYVTVAYERLRLIGQLREADRKKDDFIALLAHELRNPLAPLRNGLQVLRLAKGDANTITQARSMMDRQLSHMVRLIDDLLDISRISRSKMELRRSRVPLADVVRSAVETARPLIEAAAHELHITLPPEPTFLDADLTRLAQVFSNLLTNSAKYTERGGRIWLTAERRGSEVAITVRDTGIGIPSESLPGIFEMFSQVDRSIERSAGGLGIGLALVKGLVEMHGGTVTAESAGLDRGSAFTVRLPVLQTPVAPPVPVTPTAAAAGSGPKRRILVVDDNRDSAQSMAMMLKLLGYEVRTAHDGIEAVATAEQFRPQVILMDVGMPRLNGLDATRRLRQETWGKEMTVIALTGWGQDGDRVRSSEAGCDGHLVKPVNLPDLEKMLAALRRSAVAH